MTANRNSRKIQPFTANSKKIDYVRIFELLTKGVGALLLGVASIYFTYTHNSRQSDLKELDLLVKIEPMVNSNDVERIEYAFNIAVALNQGKQIAPIIESNRTEAVLIAGRNIAVNSNTPPNVSSAIISSISNVRVLKSEEISEALDSLKIERNIRRILLDHTFDPDIESTQSQDLENLLKKIADLHIRQLGISDIGSHFYIFYDGSLGIGRNIDRNPVASSGNNVGAISIELVMNGDKEFATKEMKTTLVQLLSALNRKFPELVEKDIFGEKGFERKLNARKSGPGKNVSGADIQKWFDAL